MVLEVCARRRLLGRAICIRGNVIKEVLTVYAPHVMALKHQPKECGVCKDIAGYMTVAKAQLDPNEVSREQETDAAERSYGH